MIGLGRYWQCLAIIAVLAASPSLAAEHTVTIAKMKFGTPPAVVTVGDVIVWQNDDIFRHTATARDQSFDVDLPPKSERRMTVEKAGTVAFFCRFHPAMTGKMDIRP
jgi:plastocyanin